MPHRPQESEQLASALGIFILLLLALYATELSKMEIFDRVLFPERPLWSQLLDSVLILPLFALPLWCFFLRPIFAGEGGEEASSRSAPLVLFGLSLLVIFGADLAVSLGFRLVRQAPAGPPQHLLHSGLVVAAAAPPLWWLLFRRAMRRRHVPLSEIVGTPLGVYILLLFLVFFADLLQEIVLPLLIPDLLHFSYKIVDAFVSTLFMAPLLWWFVARPLTRAARSEKARARAVNAQVIDAVVSVDEQGVVESFNPAAEQIFGRSAASALGQPVALLLAPGQPTFAELLGRVDGSAGGLSRATCELTGQRADGTTIVMEVSLSRVVREAQKEYLLIMRDITGRILMERALRDSKEGFRQIFEQSEDAIVFFKPASRAIIDVNATTEQMFGYGRDELKVAGLESLCRAADLPRLTRVLSQLKSGDMRNLDNLTLVRRGGAEFIASLRAKIMTIQGVDLVYCTLRDVTDRILLEEGAREIQSRLIQANKMTSLGLMVSGVAHEVNNPNNFILANARLLARTWEDALPILREYRRDNGDFLLGGLPFEEIESQAPRLFNGIVDGSRRISEIIANLKNFARDDRVVADQPVDVNLVAKGAASILQHELVRFTENFRMELGSDLPPVQGSSQQLGQVLINLLMNACQALPSRDRGILLATARDPAQDQLVITVADQGCGMTQETGRRIIEPFFTTKLDSGGTGLGLAICHSIVKEHQGMLEFTSEPGQGTTFTVRLPVAHDSAKDRNA